MAALLAKSRGLWIYLHYVVAQLELDAKGKGAGHLDLRLDRLPDGLTQYYIRYWQAWRDADEDKWYTLYLPLLATLAAAQEAVTLDRLLAWAGVTAAPPGLARLFSERWRPFLIMSGQGQSARYRFYHATLPEFFAGQSDQAALTTAEQSLVAELAEATRAAHDRLAERYLQAWGGLDGGLLGLQDAKSATWTSATVCVICRFTWRLPAGRATSITCCALSGCEAARVFVLSRGKAPLTQLMRAGNQGQKSGYQNVWYTVLEALGQTDSYLSAVGSRGAWRKHRLRSRFGRLCPIIVLRQARRPTLSRCSVAMHLSLPLSTALRRIFCPVS